MKYADTLIYDIAELPYEDGGVFAEDQDDDLVDELEGVEELDLNMEEEDYVPDKN